MKANKLKGTLIASAMLAALVAGCDGNSGNPDNNSSGPVGNSGGPTVTAPIPQATRAQLVAAGLGELPLAPDSRRIDIEAPMFGNPTEITNPLFPISKLRSAILSGMVEGKPFHTETTLLPETRIIEWNGQQVETLISQYVAYLDGRIEEVALDHYAQADDGSVWYFGEDVFNYDESGAIADREGTWLAGSENPPAMIMPADPQAGDVYRSENIPGLVFEQVTVTKTGKTAHGPQGPVPGAIVGTELHSDGTREAKTFAPRYGEFFTGGGGDVEAMALAVPTDRLPGKPPAPLRQLARARPGDAKALREAWNAYRADDQVPPRLATEMERALADLSRSDAGGNRRQAETAAIDVAQSALDFELRYLPAPEIDRARFGLWAKQVMVDAAAGDLGAVRGDVATLEWIRDRFAVILDPLNRTRVDTHLALLRTTVTDEDLRAAASEAARLGAIVAALGPTS